MPELFYVTKFYLIWLIQSLVGGNRTCHVLDVSQWSVPVAAGFCAHGPFPRETPLSRVFPTWTGLGVFVPRDLEPVADGNAAGQVYISVF